MSLYILTNFIVIYINNYIYLILLRKICKICKMADLVKLIHRIMLHTFAQIAKSPLV